MRLIKLFIPTITFLILGCDLYDNAELNPRDLDSNFTPGLVFDPVVRATTVGAAAEFDVFVVAAENISGIHAQITYDANRLSVTNVTTGDFFSDSAQVNSSFFLYDDDNGILDINYFYLGNGINKSGTGKIATILFNTKQSFDATTLEITDESELVDQDDVDIQILSRGTATVTSN